MPERCPKCGSEMIQFSESLSARCILNPKDCRIAELERQLGEAKASDAESIAMYHRARDRRDELESLLRASEAREAELKATISELSWDGALNQVESERDEARSQLRERGLEVVALRKLGRQLDHAIDGTPPHLSRAVEIRKAQMAWREYTQHPATSATAQQVRAEIEREALEKVGCAYKELQEGNVYACSMILKSALYKEM